MNKIYKIVWNAAQQAWVVVSELARGHVKASATSTALTAVAAGTLVWSLSTQPANAWKYLGVSDDGKDLLVTDICLGGVCYKEGTAVAVDFSIGYQRGGNGGVASINDKKYWCICDSNFCPLTRRGLFARDQREIINRGNISEVIIK